MNEVRVSYGNCIRDVKIDVANFSAMTSQAAFGNITAVFFCLTFIISRL